jgi:hypothetical protein
VNQQRAVELAGVGVVACALVLWLLILPAPSAHAGSHPAGTPDTSYPTIKQCGGSSWWRSHPGADYLTKREFLRRAFRRAHYFAWRGHRLVSYIRNRPSSERAELWRRDHASGNEVPSPRRWFGRYDRKRADFIGKALRRVAGRFAGNAEGAVKRIRVLRCGRVTVHSSDHTHSCPKSNPGANGPPTLFHSPVGRIVTCNKFWNRVSEVHNPWDAKSAQERLDDAARRLVHEVTHYVRIKMEGSIRQWIWDRRGCSGGKAGKKKCYGRSNATFLAESNVGKARRNNANYEFFIFSVGRHQPSFSGVWADKQWLLDFSQPFFNLGWSSHEAIWSEQVSESYLADVESYLRGGARRYSVLWRLGCCKGPLIRVTNLSFDTAATQFAELYNQLRQRHELVDVEIDHSAEGGWEILGSYRRPQPSESADNALVVGINWNGLHAERERQRNAGRYLADVEHFVRDGQNRYIALWRRAAPGTSSGELFIQTGDGKLFNDRRDSFNPGAQLIDYERIVTAGGKVHQIGIWRRGPEGRELFRNMGLQAFADRERELRTTRPLIDLEERSALPMQIP